MAIRTDKPADVVATVIIGQRVREEDTELSKPGRPK